MILALVSSNVLAGGSFRVDSEFESIRTQIPELWAALTSVFEIQTSGGASMIGTSVNERLGHRRVGPYCLGAKLKGAYGADTLLICFHTEYKWLDAAGKPAEVSEAYSVREKFVSVQIEPLHTSKP